MTTVAVQPVTCKDHDLATLVNAAIAMYPTEEARIRRGAEIVERDGVRLPCDEHPEHRVGIHHWFPVNSHCPCPDAVHTAPEGRCKHRYALSLYRKLRAFAAIQPVVRSLQFVASVGDTHGIATIWEDGRILLHPYDESPALACTFDEVVLGGRVDLMA